MAEDSLLTPNPYYMDNVSTASEKVEVVASEDIFNEKGILLWKKGALIDKRLKDRLLAHKLNKPLEASISAVNGVTASSILKEAESILESDSIIERFVAPHRVIVLNTLRRRLPPLHASVTTALTIVNENETGGFHHAVTVALLGTALAVRQNMSEADIGIVAMGGLLHDIGELYVNPDYLKSKRPLLPHEWKHVAVHPRIGQVVMENLKAAPIQVTQAISEHHERFDGSGYPRRAAGNAISPAGQTLAVAELLGGIFQRKSRAFARACLAIKLIKDEHNPAIVSIVADIKSKVGDLDQNEEVVFEKANLMQRVNYINQALKMGIDECMELVKAGLPSSGQKIAERAWTRLLRIRIAYDDTGVDDCINTAELGTAGAAGDDEQIEIEVVVREVEWHITNVIREILLGTTDDQNSAKAFERLIAILSGKIET